MEKVNVLIINGITQDYEKIFPLKISLNKFQKKEEMKFKEFVESELCCNEYGIYEYDGCCNFGDETHNALIQICIEEDKHTTKEDIEKIYKIVEDKIENYLKDNNLI